jgi:tetratricopeptide (TPR) repeat protein
MWKLWRVRAGLPALLALGPALAQQDPGVISGGTTTTNSGGSTSTQAAVPRPRVSQPIYLYGKVMVDGVGPPGDLAAIQSACNGTYRTEGYTDSKGRFSFRLGDGNGSTQDASAGGDMARLSIAGPLGGLAATAERRLDGCELRARLPGYDSETVSLAGRTPDQSDVGVIFLHRVTPAEGLMVSMTSLAAPKDAQKALQKSRQALAKGKPEDARKSLERATGAYPGYAEAWFELGRLQVAQNDPPAARASFEAAIRADRKFLLPYVGLAVLQGASQEWPQVQETTARALALDPYGFPGMHFYNALAKYRQNDLEGAEKSVREAERLDKNRDIVSAWELLGVILATRRDFAGAAEQYRTYLALAPRASNAADIRARLDRMETLSATASAEATSK